MVYGWSLGETMETKLVLDSFQMTKKAIKKLIKKIPEKLLCHQDQGSDLVQEKKSPTNDNSTAGIFGQNLCNR